MYDPSRNPRPRDFYAEQGIVLSRPDGRGNTKGSCPFHRSKSGKSFSVDECSGRWYCFGCHEGGDMLGFLRKRHGWSFKEAAQSLNAWNDLVPNERRRQIKEQKEARERELEEQSRVQEQDRKLRLSIREEVHTLAAAQRTANERLTELRRGALPAYEGEEEHCWQILAHHDELREAEEQYQLACGVWPE
jgi:CHC2 zinc finger